MWIVVVPPPSTVRLAEEEALRVGGSRLPLPSGCSMNFCHGVRVNETAMKTQATMFLSNVTPRSSPNKVDTRNRMQLQEIDEDSTETLAVV